MLACTKNQEFICVAEDCAPSQERVDCIFEQNDADRDGIIDRGELEITNDCRNNQFTSEQEILRNLIGQWRLVGYASSLGAHNSNPCATITFDEHELLFEFDDGVGVVDTLLPWEIEITQNVDIPFKLKTGNRNLTGLDIQFFCKEYIYQKDSPNEGDMFLYHKML